MPGRASTRVSCNMELADTTIVASHNLSASTSYKSGISKATTRLRYRRLCRRKRSRSASTSGCKICSNDFSASGSPKTLAPRASRSTVPAFVTPGKRSSTAETARPPGPINSCTMASASLTGTPRRRNISAAVLFPIPIDPVKPRTIMLKGLQECVSLMRPKPSALHRTMP